MRDMTSLFGLNANPTLEYKPPIGLSQLKLSLIVNTNELTVLKYGMTILLGINGSKRSEFMYGELYRCICFSLDLISSS